jgi:hypothetical protein
VGFGVVLGVVDILGVTVGVETNEVYVEDGDTQDANYNANCYWSAVDCDGRATVVEVG